MEERNLFWPCLDGDCVFVVDGLEVGFGVGDGRAKP